MSKLDEIKERIGYLKSFLTILFGMLVLVIDGLVNLYLKSNINEVFWLGFLIILILIITAYRVMKKIEKHLVELGKL